MITSQIPHAITSAEAAAEVLELKLNAERLKSCELHGFVREGKTTEQGKIDEDGTGWLRCIRCRGRVTAEQARWYRRGLAHGRGNP